MPRSRTFLYTLLLTLAAGSLACGDDLVHDAPGAPRADAGLAADGAAPSPDLGPGGTCAQAPTLPSCTSTSPGPTAGGAIGEFIKQNTFPLTCRDRDNKQRWQFGVVPQLLAGKKLLIFGEVHGSNELGVLSMDLFEELLARKEVAGLALEVPMDFPAAYAKYAETGKTASLDYYYLLTVSKNDFRRGFAERLRALKLKGITPPVFGVDVPWRPGWAVDRLKALAGALPAQAAKDLLKGIPAPMAYLDKRIDAAYVASARAYEAYLKNAWALCGAMGAEQCERARQLATALQLSAFMQSPGYANATTQELNTWKASREKLMLHNFKRAFMAIKGRLYAHMGAAHAKKKQGAVAHMLHTSLAVTRGAVASLMPVYGQGSEVYYMGATFPMYPYPKAVADVLAATLGRRALLPTAHPGSKCEKNPLSDPALFSLVGTAGQYYDAYIWVDKLTPATP